MAEIYQSRKIWLLAIALLIALVITTPGDRLSSPGRTKAGFFLNETSDHTYDRSLRGSVKFASLNTAIDFAVVILEHLPPGENIERYAVNAFDRYSIGKQTKGKGLLLLLVRGEHALKVEVSYDLEAAFPDILCAQLEDGARTYMLVDNTRNFLTELIVTMGIHYREFQKTNVADRIDFPYSPNAERLSKHLSGGAGMIGRGYAATLEAVTKEVNRTIASDPRFQPDDTTEGSIRRYYQSLELGIGDPDLPLLTLGSRFFRQEMPLSQGFLRRTLTYYLKTTGYRIFEKGDLAIAVYPPDSPVFPILLRKNESGHWLVDEAGAWAHFHRFENGLDFYPKYDDNPFLFGYRAARHPTLQKILYKDRSNSTPLTPPSQLIEKMKRLEAQVQRTPKNPGAYFALGDLLFFECYWTKASIALYQKGLELSPEDLGYSWRLFDVITLEGRIEPELEILEKIVKLTPQDHFAAGWLKMYRSLYED